MAIPVNTACLQTFTVLPGASITIPGGSVVVYHDAEDPSLLTTNCPSVEDQIQNIPNRICYFFRWDNAGDGAPLDDATFRRIFVGSLSYSLDDGTGSGFLNYMSSNNEAVAARVTLRANPAVVKVEFDDCDTPGGQQKFIVSVPDGFGIPEIEIQNLDGGGNINYIFLKGQKISTCDCSATS